MNGGAPDHHHHGHASVASDARGDFEPAQHALTLYYRALAGRGCELVPYDDDADLWQHPDTATTFGCRPGWTTRIHGREPGTRSRVTHRSLHHTLGTFGLDLAAPEPLFTRRCGRTPPDDVDDVRRWSGSPGCSAGPRSPSRCSPCWRTCGSTRPRCGCSPVSLRRTSGCGTRRWPTARSWRCCRRGPRWPRRWSGSASAPVSVLAPAALHGPLSTVVAVAGRLADPRATVESTAEAAIRVYAVLASLPNVGPIRTARPVAFDSLAADPPGPRRPAAGAGHRGAAAGGRRERWTSGWCRCATGTYPVPGTRARRRRECRCRRRSCG